VSETLVETNPGLVEQGAPNLRICYDHYRSSSLSVWLFEAGGGNAKMGNTGLAVAITGYDCMGGQPGINWMHHGCALAGGWS